MISRIVSTFPLLLVGTSCLAANFNVTTPAEFQPALTTAQANNEADTINVGAGTYNIVTELTYVGAAGEAFDLTILDGGDTVRPLTITTTGAVTSDTGTTISVSGIRFQNGNNASSSNNGGGLLIDTDAASVTFSDCEFANNVSMNDGGGLAIDGDAGVPGTTVIVVDRQPVQREYDRPGR